MDLDDDARASFTAWVGSRRVALLRTTYLLTGDLAHAEDLLQESLIAVARRWHRVAQGNPDAYVRTVIYHAHVSWWRRWRREVPVAEHRDEHPGRGRDSDADLVVRQALARLTPKQRAVVVLRYLDDVSEREAAEVLGVSVGTVKSQCHLALRRLRENAPELGALVGKEDSP